jgi:hypothetical protein
LWTSPAWKLAERDRWIEWSAEQLSPFFDILLLDPLLGYAGIRTQATNRPTYATIHGMRRSVIQPFWADRHHGRGGRAFEIADVIFGMEPLHDGFRVRFEFESQHDSGTFVAEKLEVLRCTTALKLMHVPA